MSDFLSGRSLSHEAGIGSISRLLTHVLGGIAARLREERARRELIGLNDHMLKDIGLTRIDIRARRLSELNRSNWSGRGHPSGV